jgi:hypothetical protein
MPLGAGALAENSIVPPTENFSQIKQAFQFVGNLPDGHVLQPNP